MARRKDHSEVISIEPPKKKRRGAKGCGIVFLVLLLVIAIGVGGIWVYLKSLGINFIRRDSGDGTVDENYIYQDVEDEDALKTYHGMITAMQDNSDLSGILSGWYNSAGDLMQARNILNILIIGIDATGQDRMTGNSDVMMLASVNREKKTITLCSFLRDSYTYFENNGEGYYTKLNAAYSYGGADCLISAIEHNYKIKIDYFAAVDFDAFEAVIDAIGGVTLTVTKTEAEAIEEYANITGVPYGENVTLNGKHALLFSRMRKIYVTGDVQRTLNQRRVINAVIQKAKSNLNLKTISKIVSTLAPYVYTDCSAPRLITLGTNAILGKWYNFQVYSMEAPPESARLPYDGNTWVWIVDYPYAAQYVQKQVFGETNIQIPAGQISAIEVVEEDGGY